MRGKSTMAADLLAEMRGLHDPPSDLGTMIADGAIALAIGVLAACLIALVMNLMTTRTVSPEQAALRRLCEVEEIDGGEGLTARARLLQDMAKGLPEEEGDWFSRVDRHLGGMLSQGTGKGLREALYRPGVAFDLNRFDTDLKASLEQAGR